MIQHKVIPNIDCFDNGWSAIVKCVVWPLLLSLVTFYSCFVGNTLLGYLSILATCVYLFVCSFDYLLPIMLYLSMFAYMYNVGGLKLYGFIVFVYILRCSLKSKRLIYIVAWLILYAATHLLSSRLTFANITPVLCVFTLLIAAINYKKTDYRNCLMMFVLGNLISSILGLLKPFSVNILEILSEDFAEGLSTDFIIRYSGLTFDPNFYTIIVVVSLMLLFFDKQQKSWFVLLVFFAVLYFGFITYSKSFIIVLLFLFFLFVLDNQKKKLFKISLLGGIAIFLFASVFNEIIDVFMLRFESVDDIDSLTSGRDSLWKSYWEIISASSMEALLFGQKMLKGMKAAHNTYIELLFRFGIVGCLVDFLFIKKCFKILNKKWFSFVNIGLLVVIASLLFNLSAYTFPTLWACLFMIFILISQRTASTREFNFQIKAVPRSSKCGRECD